MSTPGNPLTTLGDALDRYNIAQDHARNAGRDLNDATLNIEDETDSDEGNNSSPNVSA